MSTELKVGKLKPTCLVGFEMQSFQVLEQRLAGLADGCGFQDSKIREVPFLIVTTKVSCLGQKWRTAPGLRIAVHKKIAERPFGRSNLCS